MVETETFERLRPHMFAIAYRMLGSASDAEDVVQETFLRYRGAVAQGVEIGSLKAYLSTVVTRLSMDHLRSARVRRESYVGTWLPEPLLTDGGDDDPAAAAADAESLSMAFLLLLERLNPVERAAFLLRDVFGYRYDEIATIVGKSEVNCRQIAARARRRIRAGRPRLDASPQDATASPVASSPPSELATWTGSCSSSGRTWSSTETAGGRRPSGPRRSWAPIASHACFTDWAGRWAS